ncbi:WavE lipopolysaccharide synthesis [Butyrivibrio sp. Su6]|uniref:WavE lipopolysaccharide synthesis family protein n=1 Tax=Butyrivibrio sp. Su6 TaxID=1520810 RepID=UPI00089EB644|nr:WavE lipopolysaccharide synthesis family protein [Butyrivibrio sp. Su6]SEF66897.1 WavE lipopolysaccharide synthesis [Butyrivibrio sp. Su6]
MEYSAAFKKIVVEKFNQVEKDTAIAVQYVGQDDFRNIVTTAQQNMLAFSKYIEVTFEFFSTHKYSNIALISIEDPERARILEILQSLMQDALAIMEQYAKCLDETEESNIVDRLHIIKDKAGVISLKIRFDVPAPPMETIVDASLLEICKNMVKLTAISKDYYTLNKMWHFSVRKIYPRIELSDTAIVIQGPVLYEGDFTLETLLYYRRLYPVTTIILSTWAGEVTTELRYMVEAVGIVVLENEKPEITGKTNVKLQALSSLKGIELAERDKNIKYVLKTRTDQRFFLPDFLNYMRNMMSLYPVRRKELEGRIEFLGGYSSLLTYPFRLTDFMTFGTVGDIKRFYSCSCEDERLENAYPDEKGTGYQYDRVLRLTPRDDVFSVLGYTKDERLALCQKIGPYKDPESYLAGSFYERAILGRIIEQSDDELMHYWEFLKNAAIIIDPLQLMFYWKKYDNEYMTNNPLIADGGLTNSTWLQIYLHEFEE